MTEQEWQEWREQVQRTSVQVRTVRNGGRTWQVRTTWQGRGTRQVRIVGTEKRRVGWPEGQWREVRNGRQRCTGQVVSEVWQG